MMSFNVKILGCGSALPTLNRNATSQVVSHNGQIYLVDCAEATQVVMRRNSVRIGGLNHIFISHLHGDHFFGLFGLLSTLDLMGRKGDLYLHCPARLQQMLESKYSPVLVNELGYTIHYEPLSPDGLSLTLETKHLMVYSFPLNHRIPCWGFVFREKPAQYNIIKECIPRYNISIAEIVAIKNGSDLRLEDGTVIPNSQLTIPPPKPKSYAFVSDTTKLDSVVEIVKGVDVLYHEATYDNSYANRAIETFHCTAGQAAEVARDAGVEKLVIGHYSGRYDSVELLERQAREIFPNTIAAEDGMEFEV
ncbi:MAG: ribonuclease Z [Bacteroidales bacterium]|nr:ribonuclease Z [Bacteroidales bacterium]